MNQALHTVLFACLLSVSPILAQLPDEIVEIPFEEFPSGVTMVSNPITLQGDASVTGQLSVVNGVEFGDGSVQTTASSEVASASEGIYNNRIPDFVPPNAYTEVCVKDGALMADIHVISEPPAGGSCEPGDLGWIIERDERQSATWARARLSCLFDGMRLPEIFEWQISCEEAMILGLNEMTEGWEWTSNASGPQYDDLYGIGTGVVGNGSCSHSAWAWVGSRNGYQARQSFRCVK